MKAVGYSKKGPIDREDSFVDFTLEKPTPGEQDLLVAIKAISVNPADAKIRSWMDADEGEIRVLGWDAAGVVEAKGAAVRGFEIGDRVYYAGDLMRQGANAEYNLVDHRLAAQAPETISDAQAAALPLTTITAWEVLFDRLDVLRPVPGAANAIVIIGAAGGVGSMAIQLLRARTDMIVIATASRPETKSWCEELGANHVIDHRKSLSDQVEALGIGAPAFVFSTADSAGHQAEAIKLLAPQGRFSYVDDPETFDVNPFKGKSISVHMESMFTRPIMKTADLAAQGDLLKATAELIDAGKIRSTLTQTMGKIDAATLREAHALLETGKAHGKIVLEGF
ncbi:zinc-binding alcohol dehydrogenase family protein [Rhizobium sp.]|uniref:zinc-binding alcohol dehydrogenase family protein n=1 Tax=Rhizobium sp. TaxID=391 RepID=UPI0028AF6692